MSELRATTERWRKRSKVAYQLRPVALDELGLGRALNGYLDAWQRRSGIAVDLFVAGIDDPRLPPTSRRRCTVSSKRLPTTSTSTPAPRA